MTPKEKAYELVLKYLKIKTHQMFNGRWHKMTAQQCALIAVDEIMFWNPKKMMYTVRVYRFKKMEELNIDKCEFNSDMIMEEITALEYWNQVKQEIEKL